MGFAFMENIAKNKNTYFKLLYIWIAVNINSQSYKLLNIYRLGGQNDYISMMSVQKKEGPD